jgi:hypothetical protein
MEEAAKLAEFIFGKETLLDHMTASTSIPYSVV